MSHEKLEFRSINHGSPEFLDYLRQENSIVAENDGWLLIENRRYQKRNGTTRYAAFVKRSQECGDYFCVTAEEWTLLMDLYKKYATGWEIRVKRSKRQTTKRYHVYFVE